MAPRNSNIRLAGGNYTERVYNAVWPAVASVLYGWVFEVTCPSFRYIVNRQYSYEDSKGVFQ